MLPEDDRATATGDMHKKFGKVYLCGFGVMPVKKQTDTQTDMLITILCTPPEGKVTTSAVATVHIPFACLTFHLHWHRRIQQGC